MRNVGKLIWITGLSGAGKSTLAQMVCDLLRKDKNNVLFIDGDIVRSILGNDLGYNLEDRKKNAYRISKLCKVLVEQNMIVVCATMSLFECIHEYNRKHIEGYYDVLLDVDIKTLIKRDSKNIYSQNNKTGNDIVGIDLLYDLPASPFLTIENNDLSSTIKAKAEFILSKIGF